MTREHEEAERKRREAYRIYRSFKRIKDLRGDPGLGLTEARQQARDIYLAISPNFTNIK